MHVVSTHNISMIVVKCANCISINIAFLCALNLSMNGGALADPEYVRMVALPFEPRKKVANLCVRLRALEKINAFVTNNWTLFWLSGSVVWEYPFPGKVGSDLGEEKPIT